MDMVANDNNPHIGLMFGSFNPPHLCHVETAKRLKEAGGLTEVWLMPVPQSPYKKNVPQVPFSNKLEMCEILAAPYNDWLKVSDACKEFPTTVPGQLHHYKRTIEQLFNIYSQAKFSIVAGQDFSRKFMEAVRAVDCMETVARAIINCPLAQFETLRHLASRALKAHEVMHGVNLLTTERSATEADGAKVEICSGDLRKAIQSGAQEVKGLPPQLHQYIVSKKFYAPPEI